MPLIQTINGATRRIYLDPAYAIAGELTFHPVLHLYPEYKTQRQTNEAVRPYDAFMAAYGNVAKGGGKYTPRYLMLLAGTKLVVPNGITKVWITGELLTDDASDPFDDTLLTNKCRFYFQPPTAESVAAGGGGAATPQQIADAVWANASGAAVVARMALIEKIMRNECYADEVTGDWVVLDDDGITELFRVPAWEDVAKTQRYRGQDAARRERLA
ncbi:MAG: hypothetical protein ACOY4U_10635 [Pseudomonadota bacterium]